MFASRHLVRIVLLVAGAGLACAPRQEAPAVAVTTPTRATLLTRDDVVVRLAGARCDHEVACDQVGANKRHESRFACVSETGRAVRAELRLDRCPSAIDETRVDDCVLDLQYESCDATALHLNRHPACQPARICGT